MPKNNDALYSNLERSVFLEALELDDEESRLAFIRSRCAADKRLFDRVMRLLSTACSNDSPLLDASGAFESTRGDCAERLSAETETLDDVVGSEKFDFLEAEIGPYRLLKILGEGGSAIVYLAEQLAPIQRLVALKVIKPGMESGANFARFKLEQQALEALSHRHIAKLLDAGVSPLGRPFLALEYVDGKSITEYCQKHRLSVNQRLAIFQNVCEAVQHAHQRGFIHRDLKPSNILITLEGDLPLAKVIDFGIAKLLDVRDAASMAHTQIGQLLGTIEYMSPEQASLGRSEVDIRTDVYALSGILYELLTGTPPLASRLTECTSVESALCIVREQVPPRPLQSFPKAAEGNENKSLRWGVDLDCIVMKGLEKSIADRYATVQELIDDIRRYVRRDVVLARQPTAFYIFKRFAVRHRASLAAISAIIASLIIALGVSVWGWVSTSAANQQAQTMTQQALAMKDRAETICSFFIGGMEKSKPKLEIPSNLQDMSIDKLLESYLDDIEKDLARETPSLDPEVTIELLSRLGGVSYSRFETSHAVRAHEMLLPLLGKHEPNSKQRMLDAKLLLARCFYVNGNHDRCEALLNEFYPIEPTCIEEAEAIILLARLRLAADDTEAADKIAKSIPATFQSPSIDIVRGQIFQRLGMYDEAITVSSRAFMNARGDIEATTRSKAVVGECLIQLERADEGLKHLEEAAEGYRGLYNKDHFRNFDGRGKLMDAYLSCERYDQALKLAYDIEKEIAETSPTAFVRRFSPMVHLRKVQCLAGIGKAKEIIDLITNDAIPESKLLPKEKYELHTYIGIAFEMLGRSHDAASHLQIARDLFANAPAESYNWNACKRKIQLIVDRHQLVLN